MRIVSYKAALVAVLILGLIPLQAALGAGRLQVVAFGDSLLVLLCHKRNRAAGRGGVD